ncbi:glycosyltransferase [Enterococcus faecalis]|uniref:glycosyltransferase family 2 protein n=1 Tax=Enterococcus faecalis TaxID=1351 RepID=UPI0018835A76|nr:glycosyltransferase [Enterococcus faecalis]EGO5014785.1 glycosyltransferase [Enterococcus faecalis]MBF0021107.1 glycosyltransferase [Enterococcus faecalis]
MKILSVVVPAYNSEDYLHRAVDSLLSEAVDVEIVIVNDGSTDKTEEIANQYHEAYPDTVKVVHQKNGGHGDAVTTGLYAATGRYFKVVDSDDWVDSSAYRCVIKQLKQLTNEQQVDMVVTNYVYEKVGAFHKKRVTYKRAIPENKVFGWNETKFRQGKYLLMHSIIFKTDLLKQINLRLPRHTFYVDNLFIFEPLQYVKRIYYLNVDFYRYFIGREDQSVNENKMIEQIDQQLFVNKKMIELYSYNQVEDESCRQYLFQFLEIVTTVSSVLALKSNTEEDLWKKAMLWNYIEKVDPDLNAQLRKRFLGALLSRKGCGIRYFVLRIYKMCQIIYGFN